MKLINELKQNRILIIGDIMLDEYHYGSVNRISPEAPVPVFLNHNTMYRLGGAANVAVNIAVNKQMVAVMAVVGRDESGKKIRELLENNKISTEYLIEIDKPTSTKCRLLAGNNQQVLRIDTENTENIAMEVQEAFLQKLKDNINDFDMIVLSDYMKGLLVFNFTRRILELAKEQNVRVIVDVKDTNANKYRDAYILKPNKRELHLLTLMPVGTEQEIREAAEYLCRFCDSHYVLTTCGAEGMILVSRDGEYKKIRTAAKEVYDVTGAGDTVAAYLAMCLANGMNIEKAMMFSNYAAGIQVSKVGTSGVSFAEVARIVREESSARFYLHKHIDKKELIRIREINADKKIVFTNGCFDILHTGHIHYLLQAAELGDILIVGLNSDSSVRKIKGEKRPINNQQERLELLSVLEFIDYIIIFEEDTPYNIIQLCKPDILVKGGDYQVDEVVGKEIVEAYGGNVIILPYVDGKSTTNIIDRIKTEQ